jgi:hypothetical protein
LLIALVKVMVLACVRLNTWLTKAQTEMRPAGCFQPTPDVEHGLRALDIVEDARCDRKPIAPSRALSLLGTARGRMSHEVIEALGWILIGSSDRVTRECCFASPARISSALESSAACSCCA